MHGLGGGYGGEGHGLAAIEGRIVDMVQLGRSRRELGSEVSAGIKALVRSQ